MIAMGGVVFRPKYRIEEVAGAIVHFAQESAFGTGTRPSRQNAYAAPVTEHESRDIERIGGGVMALSSARPSIDTAAGIAAEVFDLRDGSAEMTERRGLQHMQLPQRQRQRLAA